MGCRDSARRMRHQKPLEYSELAGDGGSDFWGGVNPGDRVASCSGSTSSSSDSSTGSVLAIFFRFGAFVVDLARFRSLVTDFDRHFDLHFLELQTCGD